MIYLLVRGWMLKRSTWGPEYSSFLESERDNSAGFRLREVPRLADGQGILLSPQCFNMLKHYYQLVKIKID